MTKHRIAFPPLLRHYHASRQRKPWLEDLLHRAILEGPGVDAFSSQVLRTTFELYSIPVSAPPHLADYSSAWSRRTRHSSVGIAMSYCRDYCRRPPFTIWWVNNLCEGHRSRRAFEQGRGGVRKRLGASRLQETVIYSAIGVLWQP